MKTEEEFLKEPAGMTRLAEETRENLSGCEAAPHAAGKREAQYGEIVELANSIILRFDPSGNIIFLNRFGLDFFGYTREEIVGKKIIGTITPPVESSGRDLADLMKSISEDPLKYRVNENENMRKDGSRPWVLWTNKAIVDESGRITEVLCIGNDITDKKEAEKLLKSVRDELETKVRERTSDLEEALENLRYEVVERKIGELELRESETKYRSIVEQAVEGIFQTTGEGECIMANAALAEMLGYATPEEFISTVTDVENGLYVNREDYGDFVRLLDAKGYVKEFDTRYRRKDGSTVWVSMNVRAVHDERGSFVYYEGTIEDISARKASEEQLKESFARLQRMMDGTIEALSMAIEVRDPYTAGHQVRVARLAEAIARQMNFTEDHIKAIRIAGTLHDIGKIYVPAEILARPGKITNHEYAVLRDHAEAGYDILKGIEFDHPIAEIVLQHHERMNGTGYPRGLKGDMINMEARILAVADVVESMASHRPYRPSLGQEKALEEIRANRGVLYDENVVDACLKLFDEPGFSFDDR